MMLDLFITWPSAMNSNKVLTPSILNYPMPLKGRKCNKKLKVTRTIPNPVFQMMFSWYRPSGENTPLLNKSLHHNDFFFVGVKLLNSRHFRIQWLSTNMKGEKS